jgi:hypothetical protein
MLTRYVKNLWKTVPLLGSSFQNGEHKLQAGEKFLFNLI